MDGLVLKISVLPKSLKIGTAAIKLGQKETVLTVSRDTTQEVANMKGFKEKTKDKKKVQPPVFLRYEMQL